MGQILFLEDQPDAAFIEHVFDSLLNDEQLEQLRASENDPVEIRKALGQNTALQVHYDFAKAMTEIEERGLDVYDLLIVDRDLFDNGQKYRPEKVPGNMEPAFTEKYHRREGDYLIWYALRKKYDMDTRFYIFTGNTDDIRAQEGMEAMLSEKFLTENVIVKGVEGRNQLRELIEGCENLHLIAENRMYLDVLARAFGSKSREVHNYVELVGNKLTVKEYSKQVRSIAERLMERLAQQYALPPECFDSRSNKVKVSTVIRHFTQMNRETGKYVNDKCMTPFVKTYLELVWHVCSDYVHHNNYSTPKNDDMQVLLTALKNVILWFGKKMKRQSRPERNHTPGLVSFGDALEKSIK